MPRYDYTSPRLFVGSDLSNGQRFGLDRGQANYLLNVLRCKADDTVLVFNGRDGEWLASVEPEGRKRASLVPVQQTRIQPDLPSLQLMFAPLKQARMEYLVQKAVEMGAGIIQPVLTEYTQLKKVNRDKMQHHAIEAAEQCGILAVPQVLNLVTLKEALASKRPEAHLIFCDEGHGNQAPLPILSKLADQPVAVLIGPEGGFSEAERDIVRSQPGVVPIPLGPRILRADTACVAALAIVQATIGDWRD